MHQLVRSFADHVVLVLWLVPVLVIAAAAVARRRTLRGVPITEALWRSGLELLLGVWAGMVVAVTLQPAGDLVGRRIDLQPGHGIFDLIFGGAAHSTALAQLGGNVLLFLPLGFLLPLRLRSIRRFTQIALLSTVLVTAIEITQFLANIGRAATTDDVILGVLGSVLGYALATPIRRRLQRLQCSVDDSAEFLARPSAAAH